jgi:nucleoid-associated protein YgaU
MVQPLPICEPDDDALVVRQDVPIATPAATTLVLPARRSLDVQHARRSRAHAVAARRMERLCVVVTVCVLLGMVSVLGWRLTRLGGRTSTVSAAASLATVEVRAGDTLWGLAQRHGDQRVSATDRFAALARANHLSPDAPLTPGQRLVVPNVGADL